MKKVIFTLLTLSIIAFASCGKVGKDAIIRLEPAPAPQTFTVNVPGAYETKTTLVGLKPTWVTGDEIRVYGHNTSTDTYSDNAVYELKSGNGEGTAVFSLKDGETGLSGTYDEFYAVYPGSLTATLTSTTMELPRLNSSPHHLRNQNVPVDGPYDSHLAIMTGKYDGSTMSFRHGVAYIKLTIPDDGVTRVQIDFTSKCLADTPTYNLSTGALVSATNVNTQVASKGSLTFTQGGSYYFPTIPNPGSSPTTTVITLTGSETTYTTTHFSGVAPVIGQVYDLGCPSKDPAIAASNVNIAQSATSGNITFTIINPAGDGVISIAETGGKTNPADFDLNTTLQTDHYEFTCDANASSDPRNFYVTLTYTYNSGADEATKDVVITQAGATPAVHKVWDFSSSEWTTELAAKGESGSDITSWVSTVDGLTWTSTAKSKWNSTTIGGTPYTYIQAGGKGSESDRVFTYSAPIAGTLKVTVSNTGGSADETRMCTVKVGSSDPVSKAGGCPSTELRELTYTVSSAGTVKIYPTGNALRFYKITFDSE